MSPRTIPTAPGLRESLARMLETPAPTETVQVAVANLDAADAQFLRNVVAVLTDPAHRQALINLRIGHSVICYGRGGGVTIIAKELL